MASRNLLAVSKLEEFKEWLVKEGWQIEPCKGKYEVLRARHYTENKPLIIYKKIKDNLVHLSVSDYDAKFIRQFIESKKGHK